jgi:hypothetical protein
MPIVSGCGGSSLLRAEGRRVRTQQQDAPARTITVSGWVNADGTILYGDGTFTVTKAGAGSYTVRCSNLRAVRSAAAVLGSVAGFCVVGVSQPDAITVQTYNSAAAGNDQIFSFAVTGYAK